MYVILGDNWNINQPWAASLQLMSARVLLLLVMVRMLMDEAGSFAKLVSLGA